MTSQGADERRIRALLIRMGVGPQAGHPDLPDAPRPGPSAERTPAVVATVLTAGTCLFLLSALHGLANLLT